MVSAPSRRELVRHLTLRGLSERRALRVIGMSASALRYRPAPDCNPVLRERILALASDIIAMAFRSHLLRSIKNYQSMPVRQVKARSVKFPGAAAFHIARL